MLRTNLKSDLNEKYHSILSFYFTDYLSGLPEEERLKFVSSGLIRKLRSILVTIVLNFKRTRRAKKNAANGLANGKWIFIIGKNNYDATEFLIKEDFVFTTERLRIFQATEPIVELPVKIMFSHYMRYFTLLYYLYKKEGSKVFSVTDAVFASLGWYEAFEQVLKVYTPKVIVFSNDHSLIPRALLMAAKNRNIPTIYIQHASVSRHMPALQFDLSLLDGEDSLNKYKMKGIEGEVRLIGMPKFDKYIQHRKYALPEKIRTIGIAFNTVDSFKRIREVIDALQLEPQFTKIILRAHPKDTRDYQAMFHDLDSRIHFSDPLHESSFEFILTCDILLSGDSAIHLESKMLNIDSLYYNFSEGKGTYDLYGYIARGFVREVATVKDMIKEIKSVSTDPQLYLTTQYYNAAMQPSGTISSCELAAQEIRKFLVSRS